MCSHVGEIPVIANLYIGMFVLFMSVERLLVRSGQIRKVYSLDGIVYNRPGEDPPEVDPDPPEGLKLVSALFPAPPYMKAAVVAKHWFPNDTLEVKIHSIHLDEGNPDIEDMGRELEEIGLKRVEEEYR